MGLGLDFIYKKKIENKNKVEVNAQGCLSGVLKFGKAFWNVKMLNGKKMKRSAWLSLTEEKGIERNWRQWNLTGKSYSIEIFWLASELLRILFNFKRLFKIK